MKKAAKWEVWSAFTVLLISLFLVFLIYPFTRSCAAVIAKDGGFTLAEFRKFFSQPYYFRTIFNSFSVSISVTAVSLLIGIPFSYFYSFYKLKGAKALFIVSVLCCMSAPFIGAYAWVMLLGRSGDITLFFKNVLGIQIGSIYGFGGILIVQSLKLFPLVFIYMNGAFRNIDQSLMEASANLGYTGVKRFFKVLLVLTMPTILAAALLVFMRAFADFGTPLLIGEGYRTFPVEIYNQYLGEHGTNHNFAAAISVIAIFVTAAVFFFTRWVTGRFKFSISAMHPIQKKAAKGLGGFLMHVYCYLLVAIAFLPQLYIIYLSFRNSNQAVFLPGFSLGNFEMAAKRLLSRSIVNTFTIGLSSLALIVIFAILIAYLVVRRPNPLNTGIDTMSMLPYILPICHRYCADRNRQPLVLAGTANHDSIAGHPPLAIYNAFGGRFADADTDEHRRSIHQPWIIKLKTFFKVTVR